MVEEPAKKFAVGDMPPSPTISNPISNTTTSHKKPTRHHVKRRSSGRVHVTKLAPMARAHTPQPTNEDDDNFEDVEQQQQQQQQHQQQQQQQQQHAPRKPMKRSHSSKSIHRLSSNDPHRKVNLSGFTMTTKSTASAAPPPTSTTTSQPTAHDSPPITPTEHQSQQKQQDTITTDSTCISQVNTKTHASATPVPPTKSLSAQKSKPVTSPSFQVSHQSPAAPLAHILNATANTLVTPDKPALANLTTSSSTSTGPLGNTNDNNNMKSSKSKHLYSRFLQQQANGHQESIQGQHHQQQHHHQQHQTHHHKYYQQEKPTSTDDLIRTNLTIASDYMDKEYQIIQDYQDPMIASLTRCMQQRRQQKQQQRNSSNSKPTSTQLQLHRLAQMGVQQRTFSSSILPTMATLSTQLPSNSSSATTTAPLSSSNDGTSNCQQHHLEHRQMARQRHQRLKAVHLSSTNHYTVSPSSSSADNKQALGRWSAGAFLDRMFYGAS